MATPESAFELTQVEQLTSTGGTVQILIRYLVSIMLSAMLSSCWLDSESEQPSSEATNLAITSNRLDGAIGSEFSLAAKVVSGPTPATYRWNISDGRTLSGSEIAVSFPVAGTYTVTLSHDASESTEVATALLIVNSTAARSLALFEKPPLIGDLNGDAKLTMADVLVAAQITSGLVNQQAASIRTAIDINLDSRADVQDVLLLMEAILDGQTVPDRLLKYTAYAGQTLTIVSPALLDPSARIEVKVGDLNTQQLMRPILGYAAIHIPLTSPEGVDLPVQLVVNGLPGKIYSVQILPTPKFNGIDGQTPDPKAAVEQIFDRFDTIATDADQALETRIEGLAITASDRQAINAISASAKKDLAAARQELRDLFSGEGGEEAARAFLDSWLANGAAVASNANQSSRSSILSATSLSVPNGVCDDLIPWFCRVKTGVELLKEIADDASLACGAIWGGSLGATIVSRGRLAPVALKVLFRSAGVCFRAAAAMNTRLLVTEIVSDFESSIEVTATPKVATAETPSTVVAKLKLSKNGELCSIGATALSDTLERRFRERYLNTAAIRSLVPSAIANAVDQLGNAASQTKFWDAISKAYQSTFGAVLSKSDVGQALGNFAAPYCANIDSGLIMDASRVITPPTSGVLQTLTDGTARYYCPPKGPVFAQSIILSGSYSVCGDVKTSSASVACNGADVTITIGDNGSDLDDIFEVQIDGVTILTSSSPVRSISKTVQLPYGFTEVTMIGRAAPDGVGTYFFSVSGAAVVSGSPTSGTDLTPGTVKRFTLRVD